MENKKTENPGEIIEYSPFKAPKKKYGEGRWGVETRHKEKGYPITWRWFPQQNLNEPPETPPIDKGLMTQDEYEKFRAGQENGSQPLEPKAYTQGGLIPSSEEPDDQTSG